MNAAAPGGSMFASLTAFDVLVLVLVFGFWSALMGWTGGVGARLIFSMRLARVETSLLQLLNRSKGSAGQEKMRAQQSALGKAEAEAIALAAKLNGQRAQRQPQSEEDWEAVARKRGLSLMGKDAAK